jgi:hypothetical protein
MSFGAKETLIKAVLQSISTYAMGVFKFPFGLIDELEQIIRNFWWARRGEQKAHALAFLGEAGSAKISRRRWLPRSSGLQPSSSSSASLAHAQIS